jgi:hypothetical protein
MSTYSPFGVPAGRNPIAPGFQDAIVPGQSGSGFELKPAGVPAPAKATEQPAGSLVSTGAAGIVPPAQPLPGAPLQVMFDKLSPADLERYETARRAMFQE